MDQNNEPDDVQEADEESFPSSDPPAWTMGRETPPEKKKAGADERHPERRDKPTTQAPPPSAKTPPANPPA